MRAVNYAHRHGVVCVASTGNRGVAALSYPAAFGNAIGVAATDSLDNLSIFSNFGADQTHMAAPGEGITTIYPGGLYSTAWGTSFSAALVSGTVALLHGSAEDFDPTDFYLASQTLARSADRPVQLEAWGNGRLNALEAVKNKVRLD